MQLGLFVSPIAFATVAGAGALAHALRAQSDGRHHRRVPLVDSRRTRRSIRQRSLTSVARHRCVARRRHVVLPAHGARLRRCDLIAVMSDPIVSVERLGKRYRLRHRQRRAPLRDAARRARRRASRRRSAWLERRARADAGDRRFLGAARRQSFDVAPRRGRRHHRPQRRRQEHAAQDPQPHHRADRRAA